ncbi:MAG: recombinase family protein [Dysgonomonas sp.]
MLKAAAYLRVSTKDQNEDTQFPDIKQQAERDNAGLIEKYIFRDKISGLKDKNHRDGLNELLNLTNKDIDIVYIWEVSRLSRDPLYFDELLNTFKRKRINICFLKPMCLYLYDKDTKEEDVVSSLALNIFSKFALFEIRQKTQRTQRGKKEAIITRNESYTYKPPYGYKIEKKNLVINDNDIISDKEGYKTEKDVIESIFKMYTSGKTISQITEVLNQYQIPTRSKTFLKKETLKINDKIELHKDKIEWHRRSIHNILINSVYCGYKDSKTNIKTGKDENNNDIIRTETNKLKYYGTSSAG